MRRRFIPAPAGNTDAPVVRIDGWTVHPRACGEHRAHDRGSWALPGSSPRLRGTHGVDKIRHRLIRFIPAPAGNTWASMRLASASAVHPRACGEHDLDEHTVDLVFGSSPRLRGTLRLMGLGVQRIRFIPAPAGNTPAPPGPKTRPAVHPRACGEHDGAGLAAPPVTGSSPRLRGTHRHHQHHRHHQRFIPAPAGNTRLPLVRGAPGPVHPRACGEHFPIVHEQGVVLGSSPRLRGTQVLGADWAQPQRFIPAPAGNTAHPLIHPPPPPVHPRACGEHNLDGANLDGANGSSPRLRGTLHLGVDLGSRLRFIPAPAGNTAAPASSPAAPAVHPRACGEH